MNEIVQKLIEMGWDNSGNDLFSPDSRFKANIIYIPGADLYEVRLALTGIFDKWISLGGTRTFDDSEKVTKFFESKKYMTSAYEELLILLADNLHSDPSAVEFMGKIVDMTVEWFNKEN